MTSQSKELIGPEDVLCKITISQAAQLWAGFAQEFFIWSDGGDFRDCHRTE